MFDLYILQVYVYATLGLGCHPRTTVFCVHWQHNCFQCLISAAADESLLLLVAMRCWIQHMTRSHHGSRGTFRARLKVHALNGREGPPLACTAARRCGVSRARTHGAALARRSSLRKSSCCDTPVLGTCVIHQARDASERPVMHQSGPRCISAARNASERPVMHHSGLPEGGDGSLGP